MVQRDRRFVIPEKVRGLSVFARQILSPIEDYVGLEPVQVNEEIDG